MVDGILPADSSVFVTLPATSGTVWAATPPDEGQSAVENARRGEVSLALLQRIEDHRAMHTGPMVAGNQASVLNAPAR